MSSRLVFDEKKYTVETVEMEGETLVYRAFENIPYVCSPADRELQHLSIFVPEAYYGTKADGPYNLENAPILMPNTVGGYMPGPQELPGRNFMGEVNASFRALCHGYVVVSPGVRGRGRTGEAEQYTGTAPAAICDLKAAVRYLRHFAGRIPGNPERIISNGTSAGGALSSLLGASGNHPDYEPFLREMGAAGEKDHIFAASCYCPITNLEHADMAYEWEFCGLDGAMTQEQADWSRELKSLFPAYLNRLNLKDGDGVPLTLEEDGNGTFRDYVASYVMDSPGKELDKGADLGHLDWLTVCGGTVTAIDFQAYVRYRTRMKETPAFDSIKLETPENELFGSAAVRARHFTAFGRSHSAAGTGMAEERQIKMMNPMCYIEDEKADKAEHFRIRHGAADRDTSLAIPAMLTAKLRNNGIDTQLEYPWGIPHAGDYDWKELFGWIDSL